MSEHDATGLPFKIDGPMAAQLMAGVKWKKLKPPAPGEADDMPYATHEGVLTLPGVGPLLVFTLNDGRRIVDADSVADFLASAEEP